MNYIQNIQDVVTALEKVKGFWDETGLDMHIAVLENNTIAVSTKHWLRVHYIVTKNLDNAWENVLKVVSELIGRKLIRSEKGDYVYVNKLSKNQTQKVFDAIVAQCKLHDWYKRIERHWEASWKIETAYLPK